jgi:hypothetical protein
MDAMMALFNAARELRRFSTSVLAERAASSLDSLIFARNFAHQDQAN